MKVLLKTSALLIGISTANLKIGQKCLDGSVLALKNIDITKAIGQWYEVYRDRNSLIEFDGKCNRNYISILNPTSTIMTDKKITFDSVYTPAFRITNYQ